MVAGVSGGRAHCRIPQIADRLWRDRATQARGVETSDGMSLAEYVFHRDGEPIAELRKSWATDCVVAGIGKMVRPQCEHEGAAHWCEECKVETRYRGRIFHDLRRTGARDMIRSGVAQSVAMKISGHRTASMFRRYGVATEADLRSAMLGVQRYREAVRRKVVPLPASSANFRHHNFRHNGFQESVSGGQCVI
jgi:hypothetical protein